MDAEMKSALFATAVFAAGAVALILWQHATHSAQIAAAAPGATPAPIPNVADAKSASLAGSPTLTQANLVPPAAPAAPLQVNPGYAVGTGDTGPGLLPANFIPPYWLQ